MSMTGIKQIGIVGGGTTALMLCIEAAKLGIKTSLLDPKVNCIGADLASEHIIASVTNESIQKLSLRSDMLIFNTSLDFEINVKLHCKTYPSKESMNELYHYQNRLDMLEVLEIPTPKVYYQDNKQMAFAQIEGLELPFRFVKQYRDYTEQMDIYNEEDLADFILEVDDGADSFILQPLEAYERMITFLCIQDEDGKNVVYDPIEEVLQEDELETFKIADNLTKSMITRLTRYNRKILKEISATGAFTIKYGMKGNKRVELVEITPKLVTSSLLSLEAYELSIYEQYMRLILGMKLIKPELEAYVSGSVKEKASGLGKEEVCHFYNLGLTNACIKREKRNE